MQEIRLDWGAQPPDQTQTQILVSCHLAHVALHGSAGSIVGHSPAC